MYSIILAASISAVVAVAIYAVVTNLVIKTSIRKRREAAVKEAEAEGEMIKKERILQAKEKFIQLKSEYDRQVNERNQKIAQSEQRAKQIEQNLQNQQRELENKLRENDRLKEQMQNQLQILEHKKEEVDQMQREQNARLEQISGMSSEDAKNILIENMKAEAKSLKMEQQMLSRQKEVSDRLFTGMGRIADRYAVCDLVRDRYEYRENMLSKPLYPETGRYRDFVELMSRRYLVLGKAEGMKMDQILDPEYLRRVLRKETDILKFEYCIREKNVYALLNIIPIEFDGDGLLTQVMMIGQDVGQKVELEKLANTDGLTGLYNERYFSRVLANLEKKKMPFALYYLDLDFFKPINDKYGHDMGDKLLKAVAQRLQTCIRSRDCAFRIGGDEFVVICCPVTQEKFEQQVEALRAALVRHQVDAAIGSFWQSLVEDLPAFLREADDRMYREKERQKRAAQPSV